MTFKPMSDVELKEMLDAIDRLKLFLVHNNQQEFYNRVTSLVSQCVQARNEFLTPDQVQRRAKLAELKNHTPSVLRRIEELENDIESYEVLNYQLKEENRLLRAGLLRRQTGEFNRSNDSPITKEQ